MAYNRPPTTVKAGRALKQNPPPQPLDPAGVIELTIDSDIASKTQLGVVQIGTGIDVTMDGVISVSQQPSPGRCATRLVSINYTATDDDCYIGVIGAPTTVTLPMGTLGKMFIVKNQLQGGGVVKVTGSNGELLDTAATKNLGSEASIMVIFDGSRWNII